MYHGGMKWLNYHHLLYFWTVAREGTITAACERLRLAQPTISAQLKKLEESLGHKLFRHVGRNLALTETGRVVFRHANVPLQREPSLTPSTIDFSHASVVNFFDDPVRGDGLTDH